MADFPMLPLWTDAYLADTTHLSTEEHGAYLLLLITAWRSPNCRLPDDDARLARMARLSLKTWRRVRPAIASFWTIEGGTWSQKRLDVERDEVRRRSDRARRNAAARWSERDRGIDSTRSQREAVDLDRDEPDENANPLREHNPADATASPQHMLDGCSPSPSPDSSLRSESDSPYRSPSARSDPGSTAPRSQRPKATPLPLDFNLTRDLRSYATAKGLDPDDTLQAFRNHHLANGSAFRSWPHAFRTWCDRAPAFAPREEPGSIVQSVENAIRRNRQKESDHVAPALLP